MSKIAIKQQKRLNGELKILENENNISYITSYQDDENILLFYFLIYGQYDTDYKGGQYIGKIILSNNYPFSPPDFIFLTPNGRFEVNRKICLSITGFHSNEWNPTITISGMLVQLYTVFEKDIDVGIAHIKSSKNERCALANKSIEFNSTKLPHIYSKFNMKILNDGRKININKDDDIKDDGIQDNNIKDNNIKDNNIKEEKKIDNMEDKIEKKIKKKNKEKNIISDEEKIDKVPKKKRERPKKIEK